MKYRNTSRGFTLIELLVAVLIIGILAAIAVPQYKKAVDLSRVKGTFFVLRAVANAENVYKIENGTYTTDFGELDIDLPIKRSIASYMQLTDNAWYAISSDGAYWHVLAYPFGMTDVYLYRAFEKNLWLCYPNGTARGKRICKSLGCSNVDKSYCTCHP